MNIEARARDHELVNFNQDYELNYRLSRVHKSQSKANRIVLKKMGNELKEATGQKTVTHGELHDYVNTFKNLKRLADPETR